MTDTEAMEMAATGYGPGTGEVHARLSSHAEGWTEEPERSNGRRSTRARLDGMTSTAERMMGEARERVEDLRARADDLAVRAETLASGVRSRADDLVATVDRARIPERTARYPITALGLAVGVGFLLAGSTRNPMLRRMKGQLRAVMMAGIIASLRDEAGGLFRDELSALLGGPGD